MTDFLDLAHAAEKRLVESTQIVATSANEHYRVTETNSPKLEHVWYGIAVKKVRGVWVNKTGAKSMLVRKAGSRVVQE